MDLLACKKYRAWKRLELRFYIFLTLFNKELRARSIFIFFPILRKNNVITNIYLTDNLIKKFELFLIKNKQISKQSGRHDGTDGCR